MLRSFSVAYHNKVLTVPTAWVTETLFLESEKDLQTLCAYYGVKVDTATKSIKFDRDAFDVSKATVRNNVSLKAAKYLLKNQFPIDFPQNSQMNPQHEHFVENKLKRIRVQDILLLEFCS